MDLTYFSIVNRAVDEIEVRGVEHAPQIFHQFNIKDLPITHYGPMIFSAPVLHEDECDYLSKFAHEFRDKFSTNPAEENDYRIDELMLEVHSEDLYDQCSFLCFHRINPLFRLIMGHEPKIVSSIQLARYTPKTTKKTDYHTDDESELTCLVSLAPDRFKGGNTHFRPWGINSTEVVVPPLPKGHGLFFNGRGVHHKGGEVSEGEKLILVYWLMMNRLAKE